MVRAAERAAAIGADTLQLFADNPTAWRRRDALPDELPAFRAKVAELGLGPLAIHAAYLVNLGGPDPDLFERSIGVLSRELAVAPAYGARFVNVHVGSHRGAGIEAGIARLADGVARVLAEAPAGADAATLVLENSAGSGDGLGTNVDELARILDAIGGRGIATDRVGLCLDTAHLWGAGVAIGTADDVDALVEAIAARIGLERLSMVHLNDSKVPFGSRGDRHQHLAAGEIGSRRPGPDPDPPRAGPRGVLPRDARHGRGVRRGQHGARPRPRSRRPAPATAAGGARDAREPVTRGRARVTREPA